MRIALVSEYFYPRSSGGTEKFVLDFAKKLLSESHEVEVITVGEQTTSYLYENFTVRVITKGKSDNRDVISGIKASENLMEFEEVIGKGNYDLIHFHTLTPAFNIHHFKVSKKHTNELHFTAHVPSITCVHGDLMQFGKVPCDGLILNHRCTACYLSKRNLSKPVSKVLSITLSILKYPKTVVEIVKRKRDDLFEINRLCDKVYVFTNWQYRIFVANGFDPAKIEVTTQILNRKISPGSFPEKRVLRKIGFVGRLSPEKGLHILLQSFQASRRNDIQVHIAGIKENDYYFNNLFQATKNNPQIFWNFNLNAQDVEKFYGEIDVLCIPSIGYETGPFVLYEALEKKIPIIANNLGDMALWKEKGFDLRLYRNKNELIKLLRTI